MVSKRMRLTRGDRVFDIVNNAFLFVVLLVIILPLINVVAQSFSDPPSVYAGKVVLLPVKPTFVGYQQFFSSRNIISGFLNSFLYMVVGTAVSVVLVVTAAYPLARKSFYGRRLFLWIITFTMLFNGGLVPTYLVVRNIGLIDTRWALIVPNAVGAWYVIIARTFFQSTIPPDLYEAAEIDGCSDFRMFASIVVPLSGPVIAVLVLFNAVRIWNGYFEALIYLNTASKFPLQLVLRNIITSSMLQSQIMKSSGTDTSAQAAMAEALKYSAIVVASVPVLVMYPFIQRYFTQGIMVGSLKS